MEQWNLGSSTSILHHSGSLKITNPHDARHMSILFMPEVSAAEFVPAIQSAALDNTGDDLFLVPRQVQRRQISIPKQSLWQTERRWRGGCI